MNGPADRRHADLGAAMRAGLADLLDHGEHVASVRDPTSVASNFGKGDRPAVEIRNYAFEVADPHRSLLDAPGLSVHWPYNYGQLAWTLAGDNDAAAMAHYRPAAWRFADDRSILCGSFGARLFGNAGDGRPDQLGVIADRLRADPASRRTFAAILDAGDNVAVPVDYPCAIGVQLFLRGGRLHWTTYMRAQQALTVLPYDGFLFMSTQLFVAHELGAAPGTYTHVSGTFHIYENEIEQARELAGGGISSGHAGAVAGDGDPRADLIALERALRAGGATDPALGERIDGVPFSRRAREALEAFAAAKRASARG